MPIPDFILDLRAKIGTDPLWLPGVTAVVTRPGAGGEEVLLVQRADDGRWTPVTGIVDPGEEPAVAARREAAEETGVEIVVERLAMVRTTAPVVYPNGDRSQYLDLTFACSWVAGEAHVADDESRDVRWYPLDAMPEMTEEMRTRVAAALSGEVAARFVS